MSNPNQIEVTVVVNGQPIQVPVNLNAPLHTVVQHALNQSGNSGQPIENWELRDAGGQTLNLTQKAGDAGTTAGATLFLNLKAGIGG